MHCQVMIQLMDRPRPDTAQPLWGMASLGRFVLRCAPALAASAAAVGVPVDPRIIAGIRITKHPKGSSPS